MSTTTCSATSEDDGHHYHAYTQTSDSSSVDPAVANALRYEEEEDFPLSSREFLDFETLFVLLVKPLITVDITGIFR